MLYSRKSRNPSTLSNSGPPRRAAALPNRPNCIAPVSSQSAISSDTIGGRCSKYRLLIAGIARRYESESMFAEWKNPLTGLGLARPGHSRLSDPRSAGYVGGRIKSGHWVCLLRAGLSPRLPAEPVADRLSHHELFVATLKPRQLVGEHRHALPIGAGHPGNIGSPEAALRPEGIEDLANVFVNVAIRV